MIYHEPLSLMYLINVNPEEVFLSVHIFYMTLDPQFCYMLMHGTYQYFITKYAIGHPGISAANINALIPLALHPSPLVVCLSSAIKIDINLTVR